MQRASVLNTRGITNVVLFCLITVLAAATVLGLSQHQAMAARAGFDIKKMADMSDYDPLNVAVPKGNVLKIGLVQVFSGPAAANGELLWFETNWAAHDINKRGGIVIDGKRTYIQLVKGDSKNSPAETRKACERLILQEGCQVLMGTSGSHNCAVMEQIAAKYKVIYVNVAGNSDYLMDAAHFNKYTFMPVQRNSALCQAGAYYSAKYKKQKKFYVLCQDYAFGHDMADQFKAALKKHHPTATIVGEDFHPILEKDFTPYVTKIKASGADIIFTGDWIPDSANLLKACRSMGVNIPILNMYINDPNTLEALGVEWTRGLINVNSCMGKIVTPDEKKFHKTWQTLWEKKWKAPYNTDLYKWCGGGIAENIYQTYWFLSVVERAGSLDIDRICKVWEGDTYRTMVGDWYMRPDDHTRVASMFVTEYVPPAQQKVSMTIPPYYWYKNTCMVGSIVTVPPQYCSPVLDEKLRGRVR